MSTVTDNTPRVWIACLQSYNNGRLIGEWADATDRSYMDEAVERIKAAAIKAAGKDYPVYFTEPEEFAIHDYDNFPGSIVSQLGEYPDWDQVVAIASLIEDLGDQFRAWLAFRDSISDMDADDMRTACEEQFCGNAESERDYSEERALELGLGGIHASWPHPEHPYDHDKRINIIEELSSYIDWDTVVQEDFHHGTLTFVEINGTGYVFDSER